MLGDCKLKLSFPIILAAPKHFRNCRRHQCYRCHMHRLFFLFLILFCLLLGLMICMWSECIITCAMHRMCCPNVHSSWTECFFILILCSPRAKAGKHCQWLMACVAMQRSKTTRATSRLWTGQSAAMHVCRPLASGFLTSAVGNAMGIVQSLLYSSSMSWKLGLWLNSGICILKCLRFHPINTMLVCI